MCPYRPVVSSNTQYIEVVQAPATGQRWRCCVQVASLRSMSLDAVLSTVNHDNVFDYIVAADSCNEQTLMQACSEYGAQNRYA